MLNSSNTQEEENKFIIKKLVRPKNRGMKYSYRKLTEITAAEKKKLVIKNCHSESDLPEALCSKMLRKIHQVRHCAFVKSSRYSTTKCHIQLLVYCHQTNIHGPEKLSSAKHIYPYFCLIEE
jgi:hypothetical protein